MLVSGRRERAVPERYRGRDATIRSWISWTFGLIAGSTHAFVLRDREDGAADGMADVYLEGTDQHRGWFHSSLLQACGTIGRAPYRSVVTHGFTLDAKGMKMSKSIGNTIVPEKIVSNMARISCGFGWRRPIIPTISGSVMKS